jgi:hypothetical protein
MNVKTIKKFLYKKLGIENITCKVCGSCLELTYQPPFNLEPLAFCVNCSRYERLTATLNLPLGLKSADFLLLLAEYSGSTPEFLDKFSAKINKAAKLEHAWDYSYSLTNPGKYAKDLYETLFVLGLPSIPQRSENIDSLVRFQIKPTLSNPVELVVPYYYQPSLVKDYRKIGKFFDYWERPDSSINSLAGLQFSEITDSKNLILCPDLLLVLTVQLQAMFSDPRPLPIAAFQSGWQIQSLKLLEMIGPKQPVLWSWQLSPTIVSLAYRLNIPVSQNFFQDFSPRDWQSKRDILRRWAREQTMDARIEKILNTACNVKTAVRAWVRKATHEQKINLWFGTQRLDSEAGEWLQEILKLPKNTTKSKVFFSDCQTITVFKTPSDWVYKNKKILKGDVKILKIIDFEKHSEAVVCLKVGKREIIETKKISTITNSWIITKMRSMRGFNRVKLNPFLDFSFFDVALSFSQPERVDGITHYGWLNDELVFNQIKITRYNKELETVSRTFEEAVNAQDVRHVDPLNPKDSSPAADAILIAIAFQICQAIDGYKKPLYINAKVTSIRKIKKILKQMKILNAEEYYTKNWPTIVFRPRKSDNDLPVFVGKPRLTSTKKGIFLNLSNSRIGINHEAKLVSELVRHVRAFLNSRLTAQEYFKRQSRKNLRFKKAWDLITFVK